MSENENIDEATKAFYTGGTITMILALRDEMFPIANMFYGLAADNVPEMIPSQLYEYIALHKDKIFEMLDNTTRCISLIKEGLDSLEIKDTRKFKILRYKEPQNES